MVRGHKGATFRPRLAAPRRSTHPPRRLTAHLAHLPAMDGQHPAQHTPDEPDESYLTLADLAARLHVSAQTIYDLRSEGRGPVGFRVGRFLRFRASEVDDWLARLEREDQARHPRTDER